jgi:hypothetical protein
MDGSELLRELEQLTFITQCMTSTVDREFFDRCHFAIIQAYTVKIEFDLDLSIVKMGVNLLRSLASNLHLDDQFRSQSSSFQSLNSSLYEVVEKQEAVRRIYNDLLPHLRIRQLLHAARSIGEHSTTSLVSSLYASQ